MRLLAACVGGLVVAIAGLYFGFWWVTFAVGVLMGLMLPVGPSLIGGAVTGLGAWVLPLALVALEGPLIKTANVIAGIMGFASLGPLVPLLVTALVGLLLGASGAALGAVLRATVLSVRRGVVGAGGPAAPPA